MSKLLELKKHIRKGRVYRRAHLSLWSSAIDRHLHELVAEGTLIKLSQGLYYCPKQTIFGPAPPDDQALVEAFLKEDDFLLTSPNVYNTLGVGTTQLYNSSIVYNHKRHGAIKLGNKTFDFQIKHRFPKRLSVEFLLVDLLNNIETIAENHSEILKNVVSKADSMDQKKLSRAAALYGNLQTKRVLSMTLSVKQ